MYFAQAEKFVPPWLMQLKNIDMEHTKAAAQMIYQQYFNLFWLCTKH